MFFIFSTSFYKRNVIVCSSISACCSISKGFCSSVCVFKGCFWNTFFVTRTARGTRRAIGGIPKITMPTPTHVGQPNISPTINAYTIKKRKKNETQKINPIKI